MGGEMVAKGKIVVKDDPSHLAQTGAKLFTKVALASVKESGRFAVAISGGSTPRLMHQMLAEEPHRTQAPWDSISFFWVDERCVPITDESSNYGIAKQDLLDRVPIPKRQIHPMPVEVPPHKGAVEYEKVLQDFFQSAGEQIPEFDLIFLDPPYRLLEERNPLKVIRKREVLKENGRIILRHHFKTKFEGKYFEVLRRIEIGDDVIVFYKLGEKSKG